MIGKIILGIWILTEILLHIRLWGQERPIKYVGWKSLLSELFDLCVILGIVFGW
jgi:hypothetical protein